MSEPPGRPPPESGPEPAEDPTGAASGPAAPSDRPSADGAAPPGYGPPTSGWAAPPGYGPPTSGWAPPPGHAAPPYGSAPPYPPPGWAARPPAPKPGVIPLRPLGLGDILEGAVAYVRANPRTTLGLSAIVITIVTLLQTPFQVASLSSLSDLGTTAVPAVQFEALGRLIGGSLTSAGVGALLSFFSGTLLTGMLVVVLSRAVTGGRPTLGEAWTALRPRLLGLLGLTLLASLVLLVLLAVAVLVVVILVVAQAPTGVTVLVGVLVGIAAVCAMVVVGVHLSLGAPAYVLEPIGVVAALRRSVALVRGQFWRIFGIQLLAGLITAVIAGILTAPFSIVGGLLTGAAAASGGPISIVPSVLLGAIGGILASTLVTPFSAGVSGLLYIDQRIRREALDIELARAAYGGAR